VVGWWFNPEAPTSLPLPNLLVAAWDPGHRATVLAWLRAGVPLVRYPEPSFCRFGCGEAGMGHADLTDGRFVWPEGLAHYIEHHDVRLPESFVAHTLARPLPLPRFVVPKPRFGLFDAAPWLAWGQREGACLDLRGYDIPTLDVLDRIADELGPVPHEAILLCNGGTRQVVLSLAGGGLEVRQLRAGGHAPRQLAGWHEWPRLPADASQAAAASGPGNLVAKPPAKPGRGLTLEQFFATRQPPQGDAPASS
jgi:hypothetical protein